MESECEDESPDFGASEFGCLSEELVTRPLTSSARPSIAPRKIAQVIVEIDRGGTVTLSLSGVFSLEMPHHDALSTIPINKKML